MKSLKAAVAKAAFATGIAVASLPASASVVYNDWTVNEGAPANLSVTVTQVGDYFNWVLTVNPWNAEALGLFVDFGDVDIPALVPITNVVTSPTLGGGVTLFAKDTSSATCGNGCNINGSPTDPIAAHDDEWELVFRLGNQGFQGYQTFSWTTEDFGLTESSFGLMAFRTQQNCSEGSTLPTGTCDGSQKGNGYPDDGTTDDDENPVPEPGTLALVGLGMLGAAAIRRRRR